MNSKPNMLDRHNQFYAAFSPWAYAIPIFFAPQQILQLFWLSRLWGSGSSEQSRKAQLDYVPVYALGNVCIGVWMFLWNAGRLDLSFVPVAINSIAQLLYVAFGLPPMTPDTRLTHWVAKTFAGIGLLDFIVSRIHCLFINGHPGLTCVPQSKAQRLCRVLSWRATIDGCQGRHGHLGDRRLCSCGSDLERMHRVRPRRARDRSEWSVAHDPGRVRRHDRLDHARQGWRCTPREALALSTVSSLIVVYNAISCSSSIGKRKATATGPASLLVRGLE